MPNNLATPFYEDGDELTAFCLTPVIGKRFVSIAADRQVGGPAPVPIGDSVAGGNVTVGQSAAGAKVLGVAIYDQIAGNLVPVYRAPKIMPVTAGAALTFGQEVQSDATGQAVPFTTGIKAGLVLSGCASGADAQVSLYP